MNHGQIRYGDGYTTPYPYGNPDAAESTTSVSSLASTSSKIIGLFKSKDKLKKSSTRSKPTQENDTEPPPVPEKDFIYRNGGVSGSSLSLSNSVSDRSEYIPSVHRSVSGEGGGLFKSVRKGKKKEHVADVSTPWNIKHELHISDSLTGFPQDWTTSLQQLGYSSQEIQSMIDAKRRQAPMMQNLIPIGPNAMTSLATANLNRSLLQNQALGLESLQQQGGASLDMGSGGFQYPSPPREFALPALQTDLSRKYVQPSSNTSSPVNHPNIRSNSPQIFRSASPAQAQRTNSPALRNIPDRTASPASSTRSHGQQPERGTHQASLSSVSHFSAAGQERATHHANHSFSGSESRGSPVPSIRREPIGGSGLLGSPLSGSPITQQRGTNLTPTVAVNSSSKEAPPVITTQKALGLGSNTMSGSISAKTSPSISPINRSAPSSTTKPSPNPSPTSRVPVRPPPPPPLFGPNSSTPAISTNKANTYKPPKVIAVQGDEDEDDVPSSQGLSRVVNGKALPSFGSGEGASPSSATPTTNSRAITAQSQAQTQTAEPTQTKANPFSSIDSLTSSYSTDSTEESKKGMGKGATTPTPTPSSNMSSEAPRLEIGIPSISLEFGRLDLSLEEDLGLGESSDNKTGKSGADATSKDRGVSWSESLFSALPSATAFGGFKSSIILPNSSPRGSPGVSPGISPSTAGDGKRRPSPDTSPATATVINDSVVGRTSPSTARGQEHVRNYSTSTTTTNLGTPCLESEEEAMKLSTRTYDDGEKFNTQERDSVISGGSIASSNLWGTQSLLGGVEGRRDSNSTVSTERYRDSVASDITAKRSSVQYIGAQTQDRYSVSTASSDSTFRQSVSSFGGDVDNEHEATEAVVVARATAVKLARAPSVALRSRFDALQAGRDTQHMGGGLSGFDEKDEDDERDSDGEDRDDEDPSSRNTIRLDDASANWLMDAVMNSGGKIAPSSASWSTRKDGEGRPGSMIAHRPDSLAQEDDDSSALDDWLEANAEVDSKSKDNNEYDDSGYPLAREEESDGSDYEDDQPNLVPDDSQTATHARVSSGSTGRIKRSSMIHAPHRHTPSGRALLVPSHLDHLLRALSPHIQNLVYQLAAFIQPGNPQDQYVDMRQVAEGESGGIYAAHSTNGAVVAIKRVRVADNAKAKLESLSKEMVLLSGVVHSNILSYQGAWVLSESTRTELWIRMELMERSLADLLGLLEDGLVLEERHVARFAKDVALGLAFLEERLIAHRDVRSDNLLVAPDGTVKLADFANAVQLSQGNTWRNDEAGIIYWQAPEMRRGIYDATKVDVWSLGATVWELIEGETPFESDPEGPGDRLPELTRTDLHRVSQGLLGFLNACEAPAERRSSAKALLETPFIRASCSKEEILALLTRAQGIERATSA